MLVVDCSSLLTAASLWLGLQDPDFLYLTGLLQQGVAIVESLSGPSQGKFTLFLPQPTAQVLTGMIS